MIVRTGFVSNSSSSSFVVAFPSIPQNVKEMQKLIFGDEEIFNSGLDYYELNEYSTKSFADVIFDDFKGQSPATRDQIKKEFNAGYLDGSPESPSYTDKKEWDKWEQANKKYCDNIAEQFIKKSKSKFFYIFSYSDNDGGFYGTMEHGEIFKRLHYYRISHH